MNKMLIGVVVLILGAAAGWYVFRGEGVKLPGMKIGTPQVTPSMGTSAGDITITEESPVVGSEKGGISSDVVVTYTDSGYSPKEITVKKGSKVTFRNESSVAMRTASGSHPTHQLLPGFDQLKSVTAGGVYEYTFVKVGRWQYHNHMKSTDEGIVVVIE